MLYLPGHVFGSAGSPFRRYDIRDTEARRTEEFPTGYLPRADARGSPIYIVYYAIGSHRPHRAKYFTGEAISCIMHALCQRTKQSKDQAKPRDHGTKFPSRVPRVSGANQQSRDRALYSILRHRAKYFTGEAINCIMHALCQRTKQSKPNPRDHTYGKKSVETRVPREPISGDRTPERSQIALVTAYRIHV